MEKNEGKCDKCDGKPFQATNAVDTRVKRCTCMQSSCSCAPIVLSIQMTCSCPQVVQSCPCGQVSQPCQPVCQDVCQSQCMHSQCVPVCWNTCSTTCGQQPQPTIPVITQPPQTIPTTPATLPTIPTTIVTQPPVIVTQPPQQCCAPACTPCIQASYNSFCCPVHNWRNYLIIAFLIAIKTRGKWN